MKTSTKLLIAGFTVLAVGAILIILGSTVLRDKEWSLGWKPNLGLFVPGMFIAFFSLPLLFTGFSPRITKISSKLHSETMDYAGKDITEASMKTVDVTAPAVDKTIKIVKKAWNDSVFCKHCGAEIDKDSKFCKKCGKEQ